MWMMGKRKLTEDEQKVADAQKAILQWAAVNRPRPRREPLWGGKKDFDLLIWLVGGTLLTCVFLPWANMRIAGLFSFLVVGLVILLQLVANFHHDRISARRSTIPASTLVYAAQNQQVIITVPRY
jgi:hypothetical protein